MISINAFEELPELFLGLFDECPKLYGDPQSSWGWNPAHNVPENDIWPSPLASTAFITSWRRESAFLRAFAIISLDPGTRRKVRTMIDLVQSLLEAVKIQLALRLGIQNFPKLLNPSILGLLIFVLHTRP